MKTDIIKVRRNSKDECSVGLPKIIGDLYLEKDIEHLFLKCDEKGVISLIPVNLLTDKLDEFAISDFKPD